MENEDLYRGMAAFLMCFGKGLPDRLKASIRQRTHAVADQMERGGETMPARIARGLADALAGSPGMH